MSRSIVLTMIVRDEASTIEESLESVVAHIDRWVVVDTGSVDATAAVVQSFFDARGIPGTLHHRPWQDFGTNRTQALELARPHGDYLWMFDADDLLVGAPDLDGLDADAYAVRFGGSLAFWRTQIFRADRPWIYEGLVHEQPRCTEGRPTRRRLGGDYHVLARSSGGRSRDPKRFDRDAELLEAAIEEDPGNTRTTFYLARSLHDASRWEEAVTWYERRIELGGWAEEVFYAELERARCLERLEQPFERVLGAYLACWQRRPQRAEPLYEAARMCRLAAAHDLGYLFAGQASAIPYPDDDQLFVHAEVYRWRALDTLAICSYYTGRAAQSRDLNLRLLSEPGLPARERDRIQENLRFAVDALAGASPVDRAVAPPRLAVVGTGRSGTRYVSQVLTAAGVECGHEEYWNPFGSRRDDLVGDASWLAVPELDQFEGTVVHVVRHPMAVLRSLANGEMERESATPYLAYMAAHLPGLFELPAPDHYARFIVEWIERCEARSDLTWRLEDLDVDAIVAIGGAAGIVVDPAVAAAALDEISPGVNKHGAGPPVRLDDLSVEGRARVRSILVRFGWPEEPD